MLNRRYLRVKIMQALYAFYQSDDRDVVKQEREMFRNIDKIYDLYIYLLCLLVEIRKVAEEIIEDGKKKKLPTQADLAPNMKFINNTILLLLENSPELKQEKEKRKISWADEKELIKKIFNNARSANEYAEYMKMSDSTFPADKEFIVDIFKKYIAEFGLLESFFEEKSIHWHDDLQLVVKVLVKTIESISDDNRSGVKLLPLYKDIEDDRRFTAELFRKTILNDSENEKMISEKTKNWEIDRIAMMDVLLMKMAITEMTAFQSIPVKVSLNEYIELSKMYSTPKSKVFINGILDKLVIDLKAQNKISKSGRGLIE